MTAPKKCTARALPQDDSDDEEAGDVDDQPAATEEEVGLRGKCKSSEKSRDTDVAIGDAEEDKRPKKKAQKSRMSKKTKAAVIEETLDASGHSGVTPADEPPGSVRTEFVDFPC